MMVEDSKLSVMIIFIFTVKAQNVANKISNSSVLFFSFFSEPFSFFITKPYGEIMLRQSVSPPFLAVIGNFAVSDSCGLNGFVEISDDLPEEFFKTLLSA